MNSKKIISYSTILLLIIMTAGYLYYQNNAIELSIYDFEHEDIPESFEGYKIAQVSDLHNKEFNGRLTAELEEQDPDIIVVTGDVIDRNRTNIPVAVQAMEEMLEIAPVYFVTGNHEMASGVYPELQREIDRIGVIDLDNSYERLEIEGQEIGLIGIEDPLFLFLDDIIEAGSEDLLIQERIEDLIEEAGTEFNLLLSHRAELMSVYAAADVDLALTGHAHGGQIRLPFINGLFAPSQGFLPEYTSGQYVEDGTQMIVSRGLGNSIFPLRINNRPELVIVNLRPQNSEEIND
ncbi:metallophosphoesterase [Alkalibacterium sp. s-m-22]